MRAALAAGLSYLAFAVACSDQRADAGKGDTGGTIVIAMPGSDPAPLLPPLEVDVASRQIGDQIYDLLADMGSGMNTVGDAGFTPSLAHSWAWAPDSMAIAFSIDPRARWHDGKLVTARDVRFSLELTKDPKTASQVAAALVNVDSITVRDSLTAVAWFHKRTPEQFYDLAYQL